MMNESLNNILSYLLVLKAHNHLVILITIQLISLDVIKELFPYNEFLNFRKNAHNPSHPKMTGAVQNSDTYFQTREASNKLYDNIYSYVDIYMKKLAKITNRSYRPYEYYGHKQATDVVVIMGSGADVVQEAIDFCEKIHLCCILPYFLITLTATCK